MYSRTVSYRIACDNCDEQIEAGPGRPGGVMRGRAFCERCGKISAQVEEIIRKQGTTWALKASQELDEERARLMREFMPPKPGEAREGLRNLPKIEVPCDQG